MATVPSACIIHCAKMHKQLLRRELLDEKDRLSRLAVSATSVASPPPALPNKSSLIQMPSSPSNDSSAPKVLWAWQTLPWISFPFSRRSSTSTLSSDDGER